LGDMKLKKPAGDTLLLFAEKTSLQFVFSQGQCKSLILARIKNDSSRSVRTTVKAKGSESP